MQPLDAAASAVAPAGAAEDAAQDAAAQDAAAQKNAAKNAAKMATENAAPPADESDAAYTASAAWSDWLSEPAISHAQDTALSVEELYHRRDKINLSIDEKKERKVYCDAVKAKAEEVCDALAEFSDRFEWCVVPTIEAAHCFPKAHVFGANKTEEVWHPLVSNCDWCTTKDQHLWPHFNVIIDGDILCRRCAPTSE